MGRLMGPFIAAALVAGVSFGGVFTGSGVAFACTILGPSLTTIHEPIQRSQVVAIGTWVGSTERVAEFRVDEALKGTVARETFLVDNRGTYTAMACSPYDEPPHSGFRFTPGERSVLVLEREVDGLWQVGYLGLAAFDVPDSEHEGMVTDWYAWGGLEQPIEGAATLASVRDAAAAPSTVPQRTPILPVESNGNASPLLIAVGAALLGVRGTTIAFRALTRSRRQDHQASD